jgi:S-adenosyl-L-methionine hydrolase (adenosine-forming)
VIKRIAPDVEIIDITHGIRPQDVSSGAAVLAQAVPFMPDAVHLAVVDPGVGTARPAVVIGTAKGSPLIGPDNGLLWLAAEELGGATAAHRIENVSLFLDPPSRTFHGRDIFAPVAARLASGLSLEEVGPEVPLDALQKLSVPQPRVHDGHAHAQIVHVDHFGNLQLNVDRGDLEAMGAVLGDSVELRLGGRSKIAPWATTFSEVPPGGLMVLEDSHRHIEIAINQGNAEKLLETRRGDPVILARLPIEARSQT